MDKNEFERRLEAAEKQNLGLIDEIKYLKAQLAEMQDEPEIPDMPYFERNSDYWNVDTSLLSVEKYSVYCEPCTMLNFNAFHTKEMAQEFAKKCELIAMMLHCKWYLDRDYVPDWGNPDENKFGLIFKNNEHKFDIDVWQTVNHNGVYFSTKEKAEKCADWLNKHWRKNDEESV